MKKTTGFTLLELLIAIAIFAVMASIAYTGLNTVFMIREQTQQQNEQLTKLQMAFIFLGRDLEQYVARPIRDQYGDRQFAFQADTQQFTLTRAGWRNPAQRPRSSLQRVQYYVEDQTLWRVYWMVLDRAQDSLPQRMPLITQVTALQLRFLDQNQKWQPTWPTDLFQPQTEYQHPQAVEVVLQTERWGPIRRLFALPDNPLNQYNQ